MSVPVIKAPPPARALRSEPRHGLKDYVPAAASAVIAAGADGVMVEAHPRPEDAHSDGQQTIDSKTLIAMIDRIRKIARALDRDLP